jgi:hypothetical protein
VATVIDIQNRNAVIGLDRAAAFARPRAASPRLWLFGVGVCPQSAPRSVVSPAMHDALQGVGRGTTFTHLYIRQFEKYDPGYPDLIPPA